MTPIEAEAHEYLEWMEVHNYARTTIEGRGRYLGYFITFAGTRGIDEAKEVTLELLLSYQHASSHSASATASRCRSAPRPSGSFPSLSSSRGCAVSIGSTATRRSTFSCPAPTADYPRPR